MGRLLLAILMAPVIWGVLSVPVNLLLASLFDAATPPYPTLYLVLALVLSTGYSLAAGYGAARIARSSERRLGLGAGLVLLLVGLVVQIGSWEMLPLWYHLTFLSLLIPCCLAGAGLYRQTDPAATEA